MMASASAGNISLCVLVRIGKIAYCFELATDSDNDDGIDCCAYNIRLSDFLTISYFI